MINSYNIIGATGGVGFSFIKLLEEKKRKTPICGYYHNESSKVEILNTFCDKVYKIDLTADECMHSMKFDNCEGLLYVAGKPFLCDDFFDYSYEDLMSQLKIDLSSLIYTIKQLISYTPCKLKRVVIVSSKIPKRINSIYHLSKSLQIEMLKGIQPILNDKGIGLSVIYSGWIDTDMMQKYISYYHKTPEAYISTEEVAEKCFSEFESDSLFNEVSI